MPDFLIKITLNWSEIHSNYIIRMFYLSLLGYDLIDLYINRLIPSLIYIKYIYLHVYKNLLTIDCNLYWLCISHIILLGTIPGPIIFGIIIDSTCILWDINECGTKGACWIYNNIKMAHMLVAISKWWFLDNFRLNWWCQEKKILLLFT